MSILRKISKAVKLRLHSNSWTKKAICLSSDFPNEVKFQDRQIHLNLFSLTIQQNQQEFILDSYLNMCKLAEMEAVKFYKKDGCIIAAFPYLTVEVQTAEDIYILKEIYLNKEYGFFFNEKSIVVDIGLNVGFASLFFALNPNVAQVYSYEPFKPTIEQARKNISMNADLEKKITIHNFGLDADDNSLEVEYSYEQKGRVGIHGVALVKDDNKKIENQKIELRNIVNELERIIALHPGMPLICKIDCEGAEYNIFKAFEQISIPPAVKIILMEWHEKGVAPLLKILERDGFKAISSFSDNQKVGMLYAFR
jgi:FkbM family methyltransferase